VPFTIFIKYPFMSYQYPSLSTSQNKFFHNLNRIAIAQYLPTVLFVDKNFTIVHLLGNPYQYFNVISETGYTDVLQKPSNRPLIAQMRTMIAQILEQTHVFTKHTLSTEYNHPTTQLRVRIAANLINENSTEQTLVMLRLETIGTTKDFHLTNDLGPIYFPDVQSGKATGVSFMNDYEHVPPTQANTNAENDTLLVPSITELENDLNHIIESTDTGILFLDQQLRVRRFNEAIKQHFEISEANLYNNISQITTFISPSTILADVKKVLHTQQILSKNVCSNQTDWYVMRISPYKNKDGALNGVLIIFKKAYQMEADSRINQLSEELQRQGLELLRTIVQLRGEQERSRIAGAKLAEQNHLFEATLAHMGEGVLVFDKQGDVILHNTKARELTGIQDFNVNLHNWVLRHRFYYPNTNTLITQPDNPFIIALNQQNVTDKEMYIVPCHNNGTTQIQQGKYVSITARLLKDRDGSTIHGGMVLVLSDISDRKKAEIALIASEARQKALLNAVPDSLFYLDKEGMCKDYKPSKADHDWLTAAFVDNKLQDVLPTHIYEEVIEYLQRAIDTKTTTTLVFDFMVNEVINFFEARFSAINQQEALCIIRNITENIIAEEALQKSVHYYSRLIELSPAPIVIISKDHKILDINPSAAKLVANGNPDRLRGKNVLHFVPKGEVMQVRRDISQSFKDGIDNAQKTFTLKTENGTTIKVEAVSSLITYRNQLVVQMVFRDVTEKTKLQSVISAHEKRYESLWNTLDNALMLVEMVQHKTQIVTANDNMRKLLGITKKADLRAVAFDMHCPKMQNDGLSSEEKIKQLLQQIKGKQQRITTEWQYQRKNKTLLHTVIRISPFNEQRKKQWLIAVKVQPK